MSKQLTTGLEFPMSEAQFISFMRALYPDRHLEEEEVRLAQARHQPLYEVQSGGVTVEMTARRGVAATLLTEDKGKYLSVKVYEIKPTGKQLVGEKRNKKVIFNSI